MPPDLHSGKYVSIPGLRMSSTEPVYLEEAALKEPRMESIEQQYIELHPSLLRFLMGFGVPRHDAEDITHDTFVKSLRRPSFNRVDNLFHWLCTCAKNLAITRHQRSRRELLFSRDHWLQWERTIASPEYDVHTRGVSGPDPFLQPQGAYCHQSAPCEPPAFVRVCMFGK